MAELPPQKQATFWRTLTLYIVGFAEFDVTICGKRVVAQLDQSFIFQSSRICFLISTKNLATRVE